jgi:hypothetical protein
MKYLKVWLDGNQSGANGEERNTAATNLHRLSQQESEGRTSEVGLG